MAIRILKDDWTYELEEKYTIIGKNDFLGNQPMPREIFCWFKEEVAIPFAEWSKFYSEFPDSPHSKNISSDRTYKGELRDYQIGIFEEAFEKLQKKHYVFLHLSTAVGKTFMGIYLTFKLKKKFMMCTYRSKLFPQWQESVEKFSDMRVQHIKTGKTKVDLSADGWLVSPEILKNVSEEVKKQVGTLILDEAHELVTPSRLDILLTLEPDYLICLTATHDRTDGMEKILYLMCGNEEEFVDRFATKEKMKLYKVETGIKGKHIMSPTTGGLDYREMVNSILEQQKRYNIIIDLIKRHPSQRIMLMAVNNIQFKKLEPLLDEEGISYSKMYDKFNEENKKDTNVLLAQEKKGGVGLDDQTLEVLIFLDSIKDVRQKEGRIRRDVPIIYDLVDETNVHKNHWKIRLEWYRKRMNIKKEEDHSFYEIISYTNKKIEPIKQHTKKPSLQQKLYK